MPELPSCLAYVAFEGKGEGLASTAHLVCGAKLDAWEPRLKGNYLHFSVEPQLPEGLELDRVSGVVSGSPVADSGATEYVVTAANMASSLPPGAVELRGNLCTLRLMRSAPDLALAVIMI